jgi:hypothetical protein
LLSSPTAVELLQEVTRLYRRETSILAALRAVEEENAARMAWLN